VPCNNRPANLYSSGLPTRLVFSETRMQRGGSLGVRGGADRLNECAPPTRVATCSLPGLLKWGRGKRAWNATACLFYLQTGENECPTVSILGNSCVTARPGRKLHRTLRIALPADHWLA
jgi:hypothetical protein